MRQRIVVLQLALGIAWALLGCGAPTDPAKGAAPPVDTTPVEAPQLAGAFEPQLTDAVQAGLAGSDRGVRAVLHVVVHRDGTPGAVTVKSADPADLPVARGFAEDVAQSLRSARYRPATRAGKPVDSEFDFAIEEEGGMQAEAPH